jgi:hypothetical protein
MPPLPNCSWKTRRASPVNMSAAVCESPNCSTRTVLVCAPPVLSCAASWEASCA